MITLWISGLSSAHSADLRELSVRLGAKSLGEKAQAETYARKGKMPLRGRTPNGIGYEIQRIRNNHPVYYSTLNLDSAKTLSTDKIWPGGSAGLAITGAGQTLGIWDQGTVYATHREYAGRVTQIDAPSTVSWHATHVAGTMIASGIDADAKGMAFAADLKAWDWNSDISEMASAAANGLMVSNHSYGEIVGWFYNYFNDSKWCWFGDPSISATQDYNFGFYGDQAKQVDDVCFNAPYYQPVMAAGNDRGNNPGTQPVQHWVNTNGGWVLETVTRDIDGGILGYDSLIGGLQTAKNALDVGAVYGIPAGYSTASSVFMTNFSGWGPTDDGRIKPDVVADGANVYSTWATAVDSYNSASGTSMASPSVAGSIGALDSFQETLHPGVKLRASTKKALVIHTADEAGPRAGPDYSFGWGLMNAATAASVMKSDSDIGGNFNIYEITLTNSQSYTLNLRSDGTSPLRATICWTDPAGTPQAASLNPTQKMLVNDLDLRIVGNQATYFPWVLDGANPASPVTTGDNIADNVEQVLIPSTTATTYTLTVTKKGTLKPSGSQVFSLIVTGQVPTSIVSGHVNLLDYQGNLAVVPVTVDLRAPGQTTAKETHVVSLDSSGAYSFTSSLRGNYDVVAKASHWLRQSHSNVPVGVYTSLDFSLRNGDCDSDNQITSSDLSILGLALGSGPDDAQWNAAADLDGDLEVTSTDLSILGIGLGQMGAL